MGSQTQCELSPDKFWKELIEYAQLKQSQAKDESAPDSIWKELVEYAQYKHPPITLFGGYTFLRHLNLMHIQTELAKIKSDILEHNNTNAQQMSLLRRTMHDYADAIRDYEYMSKLVSPQTIDIGQEQVRIMSNFSSLLSRTDAPLGTDYLALPSAVQKKDLVREALRKHLLSSWAWSPEEIVARESDYRRDKVDRLPDDDPEKYLPQIYSDIVHGIARFVIAIAGGAALVVPMLIMSFDKSLNKSLITVSISVFVFALFISSVIRAGNQDTLVSTATYAAVLVVFVGTSG